MTRAILFVDNKAEDLPSASTQDSLANRFGLKSFLADPCDPIASALKLITDRPEIVAVLTDSCGRNDFSHVSQMKALVGELLVGVLSGNTSQEMKHSASVAGADGYFAKGRLSELEVMDAFFFKASRNDRLDDFQAADRRFWLELPERLKDPKNLGRWVAYTRNGLYAEGDDDESLIERCKASLGRNQFVVAQLVPPFDTLEFSDNWVFNEQ